MCLPVQLTRSIGKAFVVGAISATTIFQIFSHKRLLPFESYLFSHQLLDLVVMVFKVAEQLTTSLTVKRLIEAQPDAAGSFTLVRCLILRPRCMLHPVSDQISPRTHNTRISHIHSSHVLSHMPVPVRISHCQPVSEQDPCYGKTFGFNA